MYIKRNPYNFVKHCFVLLTITIVILLLSGCSPRQGTKQAVQSEDALVFQKIAVIPFQNLIPEDPSVTSVRCPICGAFYSTLPYPGNPEKIIETIFVKKLMAVYAKIDLVSIDRARGAYTRIHADSFNAKPDEILKKVGEELGVDGIVAGYIFRYRERKGYEYGVEQPASVAFDIHLLRVKDGKFVWKGVFDKTQTSLMENILDVVSFIKGGGKWLTTEQLAEKGMDNVVKTFPGLK
ncbi:MAG: hypothetical protein JXC33_02035 [Deltaproteobacteria bacterium]|nr:hypothetical protein [Deltaproteobacteria bacterium]